MRIFTCALVAATLVAGTLGGAAIPASATPLTHPVVETIAGAVGSAIGAAVGLARDGTKTITIRCEGDRARCAKDSWVWKSEKTGAWLGVHLQEIDDGLREALDLDDQAGVLVSDVIEDSPAENAGIRPGDIIFKVDNKEVDSPAQLAKYIRRKDPGDKVKIRFLRDGKKKSEKIKLGERGIDLSRIVIGDEDTPLPSIFEIHMRPRLGVVVQPLDKDLASYFDVKEGEGVLVTKVMEDTPAESAGLKGGDVIMKVGDEDIGDADDIRRALSEYESGDRIRVEVVRKGKRKEINVEIEENEMARFRDEDFRFLEDRGLWHGKSFLRKPLNIHLDQLGESEAWREELEGIRKEIRELRRELRKMKRANDNS